MGWDRRNSAIEVIFTSERERSKSEEMEQVSLQQSKSSSSFPGCSYVDIASGMSQKRLHRRPLSCYEESNNFSGNHKSSSEGSMRETVPASPRTYIDMRSGSSTAGHKFNKGPPSIYCYTDGISPIPAQTSAVVEEIIRLTSQSKLFAGQSVDRSPSARRLKEYHQPVYPRTSCNSSLGMGSQADTQMTRVEDNQEPYPKRSWSHSDMKSENLPRSSEFKPLGPYPILSKTSSVSKNPLPHQLAPLPLPPPPLPPPPPPPPPPSTSKKGPQVTERYVYSGTESSDSESEIINPYYYAVFGKNIRHPMARVRLSSGSLQLDEEEEIPLNIRAWESRKPKQEWKHFQT